MASLIKLNAKISACPTYHFYVSIACQVAVKDQCFAREILRPELGFTGKAPGINRIESQSYLAGWKACITLYPCSHNLADSEPALQAKSRWCLIKPYRRVMAEIKRRHVLETGDRL